jgi:hypothetical protein
LTLEIRPIKIKTVKQYFSKILIKNKKLKSKNLFLSFLIRLNGYSDFIQTLLLKLYFSNSFASLMNLKIE